MTTLDNAAAAAADGSGVALAAASDSSSTRAAEELPEGGGPLRRQSSFYELTPPDKRRRILFAAAVASIVVPACDTIYLPALLSVQRDLHADAGLVAASVAMYMFAVALGSLVWGPVADRFGRRPAYCASVLAFLGTTVGCVFAPSAPVLVALRTLQGLAVAAFVTTGQGVIADVYEPAVRGTALGAFMIPLLVGPILGPLLGGVLSQAFGWRSTFIALAAFAGAVVAPLLLLFVPETSQYRVMRRLSKRDPDAAKRIVEAPAILGAGRPRFAAPWQPLRHLVAPEICAFALLTATTFGSMFASLTAWPGQMAATYGLSEAMVGVSYLAMGFAGLVGSPLGGKASDAAAARWPGVAEARLLPNVAAALVVMPLGLLAYGWTLQARAHLAAPVVSHFVIGVASGAYLPGVFSFVSVVRQRNAAAAAAAIHATMFSSAGALIFGEAFGVGALGIGRFFTLLAGLQVAAALAAAGRIAWSWRRQQAGGAAAAAAAAAAAVVVAVGGGEKGGGSGEGGGGGSDAPPSGDDSA